jgi:RND family efflux transporter MFP subunit
MSLRSVVALLLSGLVLPLSACGARDAPDPRTLAPIVRVAIAGPVGSQEHRFTGVIAAKVQSDLGFRVGGKIVSRLVEAGQEVRRGQPLMRIDPVDYALAVTAQAGVVQAARARADQTASEERRYRGLVSAGAISALVYDQAKAAADQAKAQLDAAEAQARALSNAAAYTLLVADADGVVVETLAEPGQVVAAGQPVLRLARAGPREAVIALPETIRPALGSVGTAYVFDGRQESQARLRLLSDAADPRTRTYEARYVLSGPAASAPLGSTVTITIPDAGAEGALQVPLSAIYDAGKGPGVWVIDPRRSSVSWRPVRISRLGEETATVSQGLAGGERFVALGANLLYQGERVRIERGAGQ